MRNKIAVVLPALNESENLKIVVPQLRDQLVQLSRSFQILVVDDGSTDETKFTIEKMSKSLKNITYLTTRKRSGKAMALRVGFTYALRSKASIIVMMDADGQDDPKELPKLIRGLEEGYDIVTGARIVRNDRFIKRNTSKLYNFATKKLLDTPGLDFNSGYKVMRSEVVSALLPQLYGEFHRYITPIAVKNGFTSLEVAVTHHPRISGKSKYGLNRFWRGLLDLLTIRFLFSYSQRPLHLFGSIGILLSLIGSIGILYLIVLRLGGVQIGERPLLSLSILSTVVGVQLFSFGLLAELLVSSNEREIRHSSDIS